MARIDFLNSIGKGLVCAGVLCGGLRPAAGQDLEAAEATKRAAGREEAYLLLQKGDRAYLAGDFAEAVTAYGGAVELLPESARAAGELRAAAVERFSQAAVARAQDLGRKGGYEDARTLLDRAGSPAMAEGDAAVEEMKGRLLDPIRTNPALSPEHAKAVDEVRRKLYTAEGYYELANFDEAFLTYQDVLRTDPYNKAARRGMEKVSSRISRYARTAYDEARATLFQEVDAAWELDKNVGMTAPRLEGGVIDFGTSGEVATREKLERIMVDTVDMDGATLEEAVDYLRVLSRNKDTTALNDDRRGIDFVLNLGNPELPKVQAILAKTVTLKLESVPLLRVVEAVTRMTGTEFEVDRFAVVIRPQGSVSDALIDRSFRVPLDFLTREAINQDSSARDPFAAGQAAMGEGLTARRLTAKEKLEEMGVRFPDGAAARYNSATSTLSVRNTDEQLRFVAQIAATMAETEPLAVVVKATFVDVEAQSLEELGYDWIMNDALPSSELWITGGSVGNGSAIADGISGDPITAGNRSGSTAFQANSIDALLNRPDISISSATTPAAGGAAAPQSFSDQVRAPGILSLQQVLDGGVAQGILRGLSQATGSDTMTSRSVITRSGQSATVESIREFIYPTEYEPPELPNSVGGGTTFIDLLTGDTATAAPPTPVTPAHPTAFDMRKLGSFMTVVPQVSADRKLINLDIEPVVTEFEGFVNYGTPINGATSEVFFDPQSGLSTRTTLSEITRNAILMPIFKTIRGNTNVTVADGATLVIGGLLDSRVQRVEDGVPLLKDLPLLGRFFKSEGDLVTRRAIMIFVEVELLDPSGVPYRLR